MVEQGPSHYLRHVDMFYFTPPIVNTSQCEEERDVREQWRKNKVACEANFVKKHWLLLLIRAVYDKVEREANGTQEFCRVNLRVGLQSCILRAMGVSKLTAIPSLASTQPRVSTQVQVNMVVSQSPNGILIETLFIQKRQQTFRYELSFKIDYCVHYQALFSIFLRKWEFVVKSGCVGMSEKLML